MIYNQNLKRNTNRIGKQQITKTTLSRLFSVPPLQVLDFYMDVCVSDIGNYENPTQIQIILTVELGNVSTSQLSEHRVEKFEGHQYIFNKARKSLVY